MQFFVAMELHEKCMSNIFPYLKFVWQAFLVNPGVRGDFNKKFQILEKRFFILFYYIYFFEVTTAT